MVGPIARARVAEIANRASPIGCFAFGNNVMIKVKASGISTPPEKPCTARSAIICGRSWASAQAAENTRKRKALVRR